MVKQPVPQYPVKTLVKFKHGFDQYIGQIIKIGIAPEGHIARKPGNLIYLIHILSINNQEIADSRVTTIGEDEIIKAKKPQ